MRWTRYLLAAFLALTALAGSPAFANFCQTDTLLCATAMPVDGYCQCTARNTVEDGTVVSRTPAGRRVNATAGGCGINPRAAGCR